MYVHIATRPIGGSWETTENYQREKDEEMQRYLEDHPLDTWVIPRDLALNTYHHLLERSRWRTLGIPIYGPERVPNDRPQMQSPLNVQRNKAPNQPHSAGPRPTPPGPPPGLPPQQYQQQHQQMPQPNQPQQMPPIARQNQPPQPNYGPAPPQAFPQYPGRPGPPPRSASGNPLPPHHYVAQPIPMHQNIGRPIGVPQTMPYGMPAGFPPHSIPPGSFPPSEPPRRGVG